MLEYKKRLEKMRADITQELNAIGIHNPENPSDWIAKTERDDTDDADQNLAADMQELWDERDGLIADLEPRYNNIVAALARIDAGTFGVCEVGGEKIEAERLDANPAARTCIAHRESVI